MNIKLILLLFTVFLFKISLVGQTIKCELIHQPVKYELISFMMVGEMEYFDDVDDDYEAGVRYRLVIIRFELHESLYLERIIVDVEGIPRRIEWCKKMETNKLVDLYNLEIEQTNITLLDWESPNSFNIKLNDGKFNIKIDSDASAMVQIINA